MRNPIHNSPFTIHNSLFLFLFLFLYSCTEEEPEPITSFSTPYSTRNFSARRMIGEAFVLKDLGTQQTDTFMTSFDKKTRTNLITRSNGDTVFQGFINRDGDLWVMNQAISDTSFHFSALYLKEDKIYGWGSMKQQMLKLDTLIATGLFPEAVISLTEDKIYMDPAGANFKNTLLDLAISSGAQHQIMERGKTIDSQGTPFIDEERMVDISYLEDTREIQITATEESTFFIQLIHDGEQVRRSKMINLQEVKMPTSGLEAGIYNIILTDEQGTLVAQEEVELR